MTTTFERAEQEANPRSPEAQAQVNKFKGLVDMAASWPVENGAPIKTKMVEGPNGQSVSVESHDGVSLSDIETFIQTENPSNDIETTQLNAARLFNRISLEGRGDPAPDDLSLMDQASSTARISPSQVMAYGVQHMAAHMSFDSDAVRAELANVIDGAAEKYEASLNDTGVTSDERVQRIKDTLRDQVRSGSPSAKYPTLPEY